MRRFFPREIRDGIAYIDGAEAAHLSRVLRMGPGDRVVLADQGMEHEAELTAVGKEEAQARILETRACPGEPRAHITLCAAYMKADKMELIAQKATELGVSRFQPFFSSRCVKQPAGKSEEKALERMERISWEAVKQCGRAKPMEIGRPLPMEELLETVRQAELAIFAYEAAEQPLREALAKARGKTNVCLVVGSEGGFSPEEAAQIAEAGAMSVSLGPRILRGETAAIAITAAVAWEMGC